ncbi:MAG TPA: flippase-like domain-containing protein, partial [Spirillospora sp.]|nr:flippase-like domain-containing protein [Spirillospora sp.]
MKKRNLGLFIRLGLSVILLVVLFIIIDWQELLTALAKIQISEYLIGLLLYLGVMAFWSLRWYLLIRATDNPLPVSLRRVFRTILISVFYSNFLPTVVGTDMGRLYELSPDHKPTAAVASTVLLDRLIGLAS